MTGLARLTLPFPQIATGACALALLGGLGTYVQGVRMHSAKVALAAEKVSHKTDIENYRQAQRAELAMQDRTRARQEADYAALAAEKDKEHAQELASARSAVDRYIATHRLRQPAQAADRSAGGPGQSAQDSGAGVPASLSTNAVMVSEGDVRACTAAVSYGIEAHRWAVGLAKATER